VSVPAALHSRASDEWWTPPEVFDPLDEEFSIAFDVCAGSGEASRCLVFVGPCRTYDGKTDGLLVDWSEHLPPGCAAWCNPPYSTVAKWIAKAHAEAHHRGVTTVMLINNITETQAWAEYVMNGAAEVRFVKGRVYFIAGCDMAGLKKGERGPAPKGSVIVVFRPGHVGPPVFSVFHQRKRAKVVAPPALVAAAPARPRRSWAS
jgi:phage N-6-adenine-methyltransferase